MVNEFGEDHSSLRPESSQQNLSLFQSETFARSEGAKSLMEMEGRGFSNFCRNSSEELFVKSWMENSIGTPAPTMEMLGFKNLSHNFRTDSEELFKSWLTNGENHANNAATIHRTRQSSRRFSTELPNFPSQQHVGQKRSNDVIHPPNPAGDGIPEDLSQLPIRNAVESGTLASNLYLAKAWFHSSQPMTRSRSSELRRRYAAMQSVHMPPLGIEAMFNASGHGINTMKQEFENPNCFNDISMCEVPDQPGTFMSPSNSSSSTFNATQMVDIDKVSSVVSMLKGTLERKKLSNQIDTDAAVDSSNGLFYSQEATGCYPSFNQAQIHEMPRSFQEVSPIQFNDNGALHKVEGSTDIDFEGFVNCTNPIQSSRASQEPSQSESSAAAAVVSSGFEACDGPSISTQNIDLRERIIDNLKDDRKRGSLTRYGSVTSSVSVDKGDPTKKRRVERSRKMAEAKERNLTPPIPSDMQSVLKRCENLEKEVRSLKLNLSFMNRKDSEQTKQIEELQKQNEELGDEKERLLEEIERILSDSGRM
uniref:Transcription factor n=1 Tax=Datisca glomerata TaxID=34297 RepID=A0A6M3RID7_DATGL|nr:transcription factor [Datisca glomerata]